MFGTTAKLWGLTFPLFFFYTDPNSITNEALKHLSWIQTVATASNVREVSSLLMTGTRW
jgi:hypothetical protein